LFGRRRRTNIALPQTSLEMKGIKNPQADILSSSAKAPVLFLSAGRRLLQSPTRHIHHPPFDRINQNTDGMRAVLDIGVCDKFSKSTDIRNQYRCQCFSQSRQMNH
jgi:hypothetical protein